MSEISKLEQNLVIKKIDNETVNISINDNEMLLAIVGQFDQNLKNLSKLTNTDVFFRGNSITCKGDKEKLSIFHDAVKFLINKYFLNKNVWCASSTHRGEEFICMKAHKILKKKYKNFISHYC